MPVEAKGASMLVNRIKIYRKLVGLPSASLVAEPLIGSPTLLCRIARKQCPRQYDGHCRDPDGQGEGISVDRSLWKTRHCGVF